LARRGADIPGRDVAQRRERLGEKPLSISERFVHAPPHLKFPDNEASWSMSYSGNAVTIAREFNENADRRRRRLPRPR
jgi:hypothetical protein